MKKLKKFKKTLEEKIFSSNNIVEGSLKMLFLSIGQWGSVGGKEVSL